MEFGRTVGKGKLTTTPGCQFANGADVAIIAYVDKGKTKFLLLKDIKGFFAT